MILPYLNFPSRLRLADIHWSNRFDSLSPLLGYLIAWRSKRAMTLFTMPRREASSRDSGFLALCNQVTITQLVESLTISFSFSYD